MKVIYTKAGTKLFYASKIIFFNFSEICGKERKTGQSSEESPGLAVVKRMEKGKRNKKAAKYIGTLGSGYAR